jgi:small conductance mechanosensitive channel
LKKKLPKNNLDTITELFKSVFSEVKWEAMSKTGLRVIIIVVFSWLLMKFLKKSLIQLEMQLLKKSQEKGEVPSESEKRVETLVRLVRQATLVSIAVIVTLILLKELGIEIGPIIASAGIVGLAVGFGAQNLVRDVISGFFIILENQIRVGDVAQVNGTGGLVEQINLRTIVLRDLKGIVHIFPNGAITTLSNLTNEWSAYVFEIGVAYKENVDQVISIMEKVGNKMNDDKKFAAYLIEPIEVFGLDKLDDSAVIIKGRLKTKPGRQWDTGREYLKRVKEAFDQNNIEIPFPHRTIYMGEASKPFDVQIADKLK